MKIFISESAYGDLENIKKYYKRKGLSPIGDQYMASIMNHIQTLCDHPDIGRKVPEFNQKKIRELIHSPFRIVYLREVDSIQIIRIWRSERLLVL